jgi:uncharacterized protein
LRIIIETGALASSPEDRRRHYLLFLKPTSVQAVAMKSQRFSVHPGEWAIAKLAADAPVPVWALSCSGFSSVTRTGRELSIVAPAVKMPRDIQAERGWALIQLQGPFAFDQIGILASFATPLAEAGIGFFALSTYDTDYLLVKAEAIDQAIRALVTAGHSLELPASQCMRPVERAT